jgi:DNA-binding NtrC family response regulator
VPALTQHFLERFRRELKRDLKGLTPEALACLRRYAWPGNVRELENVIERAAVLADGPDVTLRDLPADIRDAGLTDGVAREAARTYHAAVEEFKRGLIASTLRRTAGNRTRAARILGLQRTYLARLIRDLGLAGPRPIPALTGEPGPLPARAAAAE